MWKHYFESGFYWEQITDKSVGVGQPNVNGSSLKSLLIPLPPYQEQEQISQEAQKLTSLIGAIEDSEGDLSTYIHNAKSRILDLAIRGKLVPQDPDDEPASVLLERIKAERPATKKKAPKTRDNSHYENLTWSVPSNWCWCCLSDICSFERGITFPSSAKHTFEQENLLPCIRTANVQEQLELEDLWYIAPSYIRGNVDKLVKNGDIIMSSANSG